VLALPQVGLAVLFPRPSQDRNSGAAGRGGGGVGITAPGGRGVPGPGGRGVSRMAGGAGGAGRRCWALRPNGIATVSNSAPIVRGAFRIPREGEWIGILEEGVEVSVFMRGLECCFERFPNRLVAFWQHPHFTPPPSRVCEEHSRELLRGGKMLRRPWTFTWPDSSETNGSHESRTGTLRPVQNREPSHDVGPPVPRERCVAPSRSNGGR